MKFLIYIFMIVPGLVCATSIVPKVLEPDPEDIHNLGISFFEDKDRCGFDTSWVVISLPDEFNSARLAGVFLSVFNGQKLVVGTNLPKFKNTELGGVTQSAACLHPSVFEVSEIIISFKKGMHITNEIKLKNLERFLN